MRVHAIPIRLASPPRHHHTPRRTACGGGGAGGPKQLRSRRRPSPVRAFDTAERALAAHPPSLRADDASRARSAGALLFSSTRPPPLPVPEKIRGDHPILLPENSFARWQHPLPASLPPTHPAGAHQVLVGGSPTATKSDRRVVSSKTNRTHFSPCDQ